jgi:hypothetical protein
MLPTHLAAAGGATPNRKREPQKAITYSEVIRPFSIAIPDAELTDLRQRLAATR